MTLPRIPVVTSDDITLLIDGIPHYLYHINGHDELTLYAHRAKMSKVEMAQLIHEHLQPIVAQARELEATFAAEHGLSAEEAESLSSQKNEAWWSFFESGYGDVYMNARDAAMAAAGFMEIKSATGFFSTPTGGNVHQANESLPRIARGEE